MHMFCSTTMLLYFCLAPNKRNSVCQRRIILILLCWNVEQNYCTRVIRRLTPPPTLLVIQGFISRSGNFLLNFLSQYSTYTISSTNTKPVSFTVAVPQVRSLRRKFRKIHSIDIGKTTLNRHFPSII